MESMGPRKRHPVGYRLKQRPRRLGEPRLQATLAASLFPPSPSLGETMRPAVARRASYGAPEPESAEAVLREGGSMVAEHAEF